MSRSSPDEVPVRPTASDVAARAGVSRTTVSYILNRTRGQSFPQATREAVLRAAAELGYRPNLAARLLATGHGPLLFVVPRLGQNEITSAIAERITQALAMRGFLVVAIFETADSDALRRALDDLHPQGVVFYAPPDPVVGQTVRDHGAHVIEPAHREEGPLSIGRLQVAHLVARGHRKIAIAVPYGSDAFSVESRRVSVQNAAAGAGLPDTRVAPFAADGSDAAARVRAWAASGVSAVCAYNDSVALAVLHGVRAAGLICPDGIAVIGADGTPGAALAVPPLTTVAIDPEIAADWFVARLLTELGHADAPAPNLDNAIRLVQRQTT